MILQTENLTKQYKHTDGIINAIDNVSLNIEKGSFVTITGPSGSGKSTLLLCIGGLLKPTFGIIKFNGNTLNTQNDNELAGFRKNYVGFVMQNFALIPYLTAVENITMALALHKMDKRQQFNRAMTLLELVGLQDRINHLPAELSAGQQQRVAIARALANEPPLILADEPTGNLDPSLSLEILELMKDINVKLGITVVMVTHSPMAAGYGNLKIQLTNGKLINHHQAKDEETLKISIN